MARPPLTAPVKYPPSRHEASSDLANTAGGAQNTAVPNAADGDIGSPITAHSGGYARAFSPDVNSLL
jgi:hypothetical protein